MCFAILYSFGSFGDGIGMASPNVTLGMGMPYSGPTMRSRLSSLPCAGTIPHMSGKLQGSFGLTMHAHEPNLMGHRPREHPSAA